MKIITFPGVACNHPYDADALRIGSCSYSENHRKDSGEDFFLPIRVISRLFRGRYLAELKRLWEDGQLELRGTAEPSPAIIKFLYNKDLRIYKYLFKAANLCYSDNRQRRR